MLQCGESQYIRPYSTSHVVEILCKARHEWSLALRIYSVQDFLKPRYVQTLATLMSIRCILSRPIYIPPNGSARHLQVFSCYLSLWGCAAETRSSLPLSRTLSLPSFQLRSLYAIASGLWEYFIAFLAGEHFTCLIHRHYNGTGQSQVCFSAVISQVLFSNNSYFPWHLGSYSFELCGPTIDCTVMKNYPLS